MGLCRPCSHIRSSRAPYRKQTDVVLASTQQARSLTRAPPALSRQQKPCIRNIGSLGSSCRPGQTPFSVLIPCCKASKLQHAHSKFVLRSSFDGTFFVHLRPDCRPDSISTNQNIGLLCCVVRQVDGDTLVVILLS